MLAMAEREARGGPSRTCVGCLKTATPEAMVRFVLGPEATLVPVLGGPTGGRGAWVHPSADCLGAAARRGFAKSLRAAVRVDADELAALVRAAADRRVVGLLAGGLGARLLAVGGAEAMEALQRSRACLVIVATDARAAAESQEVQAAVKAGMARAWGTKAELGRATKRHETGVVAVLDPGLGRSLAQTIDWAHTSGPGARREAGGQRPTEE